MGSIDNNCTKQEASQLFDLINSENKDLIFFDCRHKLPEDHAPIAVD
jgi:hypothetical protein